MHKNTYLLFMGFFFALCFSLSGGVWWSLSELEAVREEYDLLENERSSSVSMMESMQSKNIDLTEITGLNIDNAGSAKDPVEFYSYVRQAIENNNIELISMNANSDNDGILSLQVQGTYGSLAHLIADWRNMPFASRINSLNLRREASAPSNSVSVRVVLEAMMEEK